MREPELERTLFGVQLTGELEAFLRDTNPWWQSKPMRVLPPFRRWLFDHILQHLKGGAAPVTVVRGPRQVGKTTLQEQIIDHLLHQEGVNPKRIFRVQFDGIPSLRELKDPLLGLCRWFERRVLGGTLNEWAHNGEPICLFVDEVQNLTDWASQIKALVDHHSVRVLLTGSAALGVEHDRDSLAGRISVLELNTLLLREIASLRGWGELPSPLPFDGLKMLKDRNFWEALREYGIRHREVRDQAFGAFAERGGYPIAQIDVQRPWEEVADQLNEAVIRQVIHHDLMLGERGKERDENLLEEVFRLSCRYAGRAPGQPVFVNELRSALSANVGWRRVLAYLRFLDEALLIRLIPPLELRLKRRKEGPKICCDHSLRASRLQEILPITPDDLQHAPHLSDLSGYLAESIAGSFLSQISGLDLSWFPERSTEPEVDFVLTVGPYRIPLEVRYRGHIDEHLDTLGLRAFMEKTVNNAPFGVLITLSDDASVADPRIVTLPLSSLLLMR